MNKAFSNTNITFSLENITIHAPNILFERFTNAIPSHSHGAGCYEIHYIPTGYGTLLANNTRYEITPETLYVTGPFLEHSQYPSDENPMQEYCIYLQFPKSYIPAANTPIVNLFTANPFWFGQDTQNIRSVMEDLFTEITAKYTGYQNQIELLLARLLILIVRNYEKSTTRHSQIIQKSVDNGKTLIIEEYFLYEYQNASLNALSARLNLSPRQTQRLLQEYYGKSFQQKKTDAKMSAAVILLQDKQKSITDIADALGYSSPEHFSGAFKAYYQKSPREYRKISAP